jgi:peptidoglycan/LPS O-acetylase OafA/YrhL
MHLNDTSGAMGMALFFTLSGFLITQFLAAGMPVRDFLARRLARIIPLGWAAVTILLLWNGASGLVAIRNYAFIENLPPQTFLRGGEHLWSLCVEMQFYLSVALICLILGRRGLYLIPVLAIAVTGARIAAGQPISIVTWHRIDEILSGGVFALIYAGWFGGRTRDSLLGLPVWPFAIALVVCSHPDAGILQYLRPYAAALLVGSSIGGCSDRLRRVLVSRPMAYIAEISYALYVIHGMLSASWLGSGDKLTKYIKRPLLFAVTFALAHISTRYYEQPITRRVRQWTKSWRIAA